MHMNQIPTSLLNIKRKREAKQRYNLTLGSKLPKVKTYLRACATPVIPPGRRDPERIESAVLPNNLHKW